MGEGTIGKEPEQVLKIDKLEDDDWLGIAFHGMYFAEKAFNDHIQSLGYDPAFYDIRITVWEKDSNFERRLRRYEVESECKE